MLVEKGKYARIRNYILKPGERHENVPGDTAQVPFKSWVKGHLLEEAELYEEASIKTATGRTLRGVVKEVEPRYRHDFGDFVSEIHKIRNQILKDMWGNENE